MAEVIELRGTQTYCEVAGHGPPLLMLHGAEGSRRQFTAIRPELEPHFTVITYDQRDCGDTANPETPATLVTLADDAKALLEALGYPTAHVFGTSFGGRVAQALTARHAAAVRRLVLASTWPLPLSLATANAEVAHVLGQLRSQLPASAELLAEYFYPPDYLAAHPAARRHFASAPARSDRSDRRRETVTDNSDLNIARIGQPTLLIAGAMDRIVPPELTLALAESISDTQAIVLPGVGHLGVTQAPAAVARHVVDFLSRD
ncbi:alpha/beta fold hydrolase [Variovorax rhizosphaerae]|uniref:Alpha/beta fold hydrolase n=1 Tax=Variovorax rhizosphaerae TaxID=1836200 RepID=A0ABU8WVD9_9BURK